MKRIIKNILSVDQVLDLDSKQKLVFYSKDKNVSGRHSVPVTLSSIRKGSNGLTIMFSCIRGNYNIIVEIKDYKKNWVVNKFN